jgi:hypothetical protein
MSLLFQITNVPASHRLSRPLNFLIDAISFDDMWGRNSIKLPKLLHGGAVVQPCCTANSFACVHHLYRMYWVSGAEVGEYHDGAYTEPVGAAALRAGGTRRGYIGEAATYPSHSHWLDGVHRDQPDAATRQLPGHLHAVDRNDPWRPDHGCD